MSVWSVEQVASVAPSGRAMSAAETVASPARWSALGSDERALWGRCRGSGAEPYDTMVDHVQPGWRCTCPSRQLPCKHALALLLLWVRGSVPAATAATGVSEWLAGRDGRRESAGDTDRGVGVGERGEPGGDDDVDDAAPPGRDELDGKRDERVARMRAGLVELDRWLVDRMRNGLADPALARYDTWDHLAARLVDAQAGALANRVRRLAGLVGASPDWHSEVLAEMGLLHLLAEAGLRVPELPGALADAVAASTGWQVRKADVLAGVPDTDDWLVAGRSDQREDRIEVRRVWLFGLTSGRWAMLLSFAAYQQALDDSLTVGTVVPADLHRYPGPALRALMGRSDAVRDAEGLVAVSVADACDSIGSAVAAEPWLERFPAMVRAAPTVMDGRWVLSDETGALPLLGDERSLAKLVAASAGSAVPITVEWTPHGVVPLAVGSDDRILDIGPVADPGFVTVEGSS